MTDRLGTRKRRGGISVGAALIGLSIVLSGCLGSNFAYYSHSNRGTDLYFKIPSGWHVFSAKQLVEATNGLLSQTQLNQIEGSEWETSFSAAPHPSAKQLILESSTYPNGFVFARQLAATDRDTLSYAALRSEILGQDPFSSQATVLFNVLSYTEFTRPGGIRGSKLVTDVSGSNGLIETYAQVLAVDASANYVYGIGVACRASCWGPNQGLINQVLNSWNVKEQNR
jgi:hypothetical protein